MSTPEGHVSLDVPKEELRALWHAATYKLTSFPIPPGVRANVLFLAVEAGIACRRHPEHEIGAGWFQDPETFAEWRPGPGECFWCAAEDAQANKCRCGAIIHIPGGRGKPVPEFCKRCREERERMGPEGAAALDAAHVTRERELADIRMRREDREMNAPAKPKRKKKG